VFSGKTQIFPKKQSRKAMVKVLKNILSKHLETQQNNGALKRRYIFHGFQQELFVIIPKKSRV